VHLFDWDELNFAEAAREMLATGDWLRVTIDYQPFWEKPPLFIWLQALSMLAFGVNEFAARLPNALVGIVTLVVVYRVGRQVASAQLGWLWALAYACSMLPHLYFRTGIIDPLFNLLIFLGIVQLWRYYHAIGGWQALMFGGLWCGLAILTKGPVALLLTGLTWGVVWAVGLAAPKGSTARVPFPLWQGLVFVAASCVAAGLWFGIDAARNGPWFVQTFVEYQIRLLTTGDAGHSQPFYYHPLVLLIGCFPASVFVFAALKRSLLWGNLTPHASLSHKPLRPSGPPPLKTGEESESQLAFFRWMLWLMLVVVVVFSLVQTKIIHYSSLAYFPITALAALTLDRMLRGELRWRGYHTALLIVIGLIWVLALLAVPTIGMLATMLIELIKNNSTIAILSLPVQWTGFELLIGFGLAIGLVMALGARSAGDIRTAVAILFLSTALSLATLLPVIVPKVEGYSQRSAIAFYERYRGCECYVQTLRYKSYGQYFYAHRPRRFSSAGVGVGAAEFENWVLSGPIDKPAYLLTRLKDAERYTANPELVEIYRAGGFVGYKREVPTGSNLAEANN
jgi:4-amino-4-deoxy-L-arabinose transferase-like glycosyltransferase